MKKTRTCAECIHVSLCTLYWAAEVSSVRWHTIAEESDIGGWYRRASRRNLATGGWLVSNNYDVRRHRPRLRYANINHALKSWQLQPVESTETSKPEEQPSTMRSREIIVAESMKSVWLVLVLVCVCVLSRIDFLFSYSCCVIDWLDVWRTAVCYWRATNEFCSHSLDAVTTQQYRPYIRSFHTLTHETLDGWFGTIRDYIWTPYRSRLDVLLYPLGHPALSNRTTANVRHV